jgi:cephalosporin-C deacetylase-like acetyl esterase
MITKTENEMSTKNIISAAIMFFLCLTIKAQQNDYKVYEGITDTLQNAYFLHRLDEQFDLRREKFNESLISSEAVLERKKQMQEWYKNIIVKLPPKTDLKIITTKKEEYKDYTIEWVAFESQPNHHVTGLFYLPKNSKPPYPAVYIPCGHSFNGKASETYQKAARLFAMNGFAVLQADPICQGERLQYLDEKGKPITPEKTHMHEILGQHLMLTGSNSLIHELFDNIRCLDFLEQQPLVDKTKLAVAGNSGGGTQTTYLAAFDKRIKVAVPSCYIATTEKKFNTIGSQDGCQQLWGEGKAGVEEQDFLLMAAPTPIEILSATEDFFNKDGAKAAYEELKKAYTVLGVPEKVKQVFAEGTHGWQKSLREESVRWCKKWLMNDDSPIVEPDDIGFFENEKDCWVTASGQVLTTFKNEKSVADISRERVVECRNRRKVFQSTKSGEELINKIKEVIGYEEPLNNSSAKLINSFEDDKCKVEKYLLNRDSKYDFSLPAILFIPKEKREENNAVIIVNENGKLDEIQKGNRIKSELEKGNIVLALDVCNTGELKDKREAHYDNKEFWIAKLPLYEGKTLLAYRTEDIIIAKNFLEKKLKPQSINLISAGFIGPAALHAAVFAEDFSKVEIINSIKSWEEVASSNYSSDQLGNIVPDVLNYYDLPDLLKLIPKTKVVLRDK